MFVFKTLLTGALYSVLCIAAPGPIISGIATQPHLDARQLANGVALRILPLGDSITYGYQSSDGNGYRQDLLNKLSANPVQYVGTLRAGTMVENYNEGHSGAVITEIASYAALSLPERPNVVLLMAGTNNVNKQIDVDQAPVQLGNLIDQIIAACPDAVVLVAQLTPITDPASQSRANTFDAAIPAIVATRVAAGHSVLVVDMMKYVSSDNLADGLHPNDVGYNQMAEAWCAGLLTAASNGWINTPVPSQVSYFTGCNGSLSWDPLYHQIAVGGVGHGDAGFTSNFVSAGRLAEGNVGTGKSQGAGVHLADLNGDGRDDYAWVDPDTGAVTLYLNGGYTAGRGINWVSMGVVAYGVGDGPGVMFADINGDGRDDYLWVAPNGDVKAYINGGPNPSGGWIWSSIGVICTGATRATTRFADIDGDGRAEYLVVGPTGSLTAWFNSGFEDAPAWQYMGEIAVGLGDSTDSDGVFLQDMNGDGRADYLWLNSWGIAASYINTRGPSAGLAPSWLSAGIIATGVGASRKNVIFGDLDGDGNKDYVVVDANTGALDVWFQKGYGGAYVRSDGIRFADMTGDGRDDYLWLEVNGAVTMYRNDGFSQVAGEWQWVSQGVIMTGAGPRKDIRLADLDGDGLADYLVVDENSGAVTLWKNGGPNPAASGGWDWSDQGQIATGVGLGVGVHFADINGDKLADYLWVDAEGVVTAYLNGGNSASGWIWKPQGIIAWGVGAAREDVQFHDLDGDGKADYIWVDRMTGSAQVWQNLGPSVSAGWVWSPLGQLAYGVGANGPCIQFADTTGSGRSDYLNVHPSSGSVTEWYNVCPDSPLTPEQSPPDWMHVTCTHPAVLNAALDQTVRWNDLDTNRAWAAAVASWTANPFPHGLVFSEQVSNFFNGPENMLCGTTVDHNGCETSVTCKDVNHPAGYFILNSLGEINNMNLNFYDAIVRIEAQITATVGDFQNTFSPILDESVTEKLILDLVGLGFALAASPVWNVILKELPYFVSNSNLLGTIKDMSNPMVSNGITITKDTSTSGPNALNTQNTLDTAVAKMVRNWYQAIAGVNSQLFNGSAASVAQLAKMISLGQLLEPVSIPSDVQIQTFLGNAIYGYLIPQGWALSNSGVFPFILDSGFDCSVSYPLPSYVSNADADTTGICYQNKWYYILSTTGKAQDCPNPNSPLPCNNHLFSAPPGISALVDGAWSGVTKSDFIIGSVAGYQKNGNKNGWPPADPTDPNVVSAIYDTSLRTPGVMMIPVCSAQVAFYNWQESPHAGKGPNYPCDPIS